MTITDLVAPEAILPALKVISKKQALQELSARDPPRQAAQTGKAVRLLRASRTPDRFRGDGRPAGRPRVPAAGAGRRGRRSPEGAGADRAAFARSGRRQEATRLARCAGDLFGAGAATGECRVRFR